MFNNKINFFKALLKSKKYDNIILLGYNCEIAFRFFQQYHFLDSSLFAWTGVTLEQLKYFLENSQDVGVDFSLYGNLFKCVKSGILFHGRTNLTATVHKLQGEALEIEKAELRSRIAYLKDKFFEYSTNGKNTLYIRKIIKDDVDDPNFQQNILYLYNKLSSICKNEFKLLLIVEEENYKKVIFDNENILIRTVHKFSPNADVTNKKYGDKLGWRNIFTEFQPAMKKKQTKKFKFEECD